MHVDTIHEGHEVIGADRVHVGTLLLMQAAEAKERWSEESS